MHDTIRSILRYYLICAVWLAVTLGIGFAALGPVDTILSGFDASAVVRGLTAMAVGVAAGSLVAWLLWISLPVRRTSRVRPVAGDQKDVARATLA
jgi:xanthine/uracil permease